MRNRKIFFFILLAVSLLTSAAEAVSLDVDSCTNVLNGTWTAVTNTCRIASDQNLEFSINY